MYTKGSEGYLANNKHLNKSLLEWDEVPNSGSFLWYHNCFIKSNEDDSNMNHYNTCIITAAYNMFSHK